MSKPHSPKSVLVVDDTSSLHDVYTSHPELGEKVVCVFNCEEAIVSLQGLEPSAFPDVLIVDCMGNSPLDSLWQTSRCGDLYARRMIEVYRKMGATLPHVLFKSADESIAHKAFKNLVNL